MKQHGRIVVLRGEVVGGDLEGFVHALADGDRRHHHDEFGEAVLLVHFKYRLGVDVGFARAGFHFDTELVARQIIGERQVVALLHGLHIGGKLCIIYGERVANAQTGVEVELPLIDDGKGILPFFLPAKEVNHGGYRICLEGLGFEF